MNSPTPAFSFVYGERPSADLLGDWATELASEWRDPHSGLVVTLVTEPFASSNACEWYLVFENRGTEASLILDKVLPLDGRWAITPSQYELPRVVVGRSRGSSFSIADFEYQEDLLLADDSISMGGGAGRPSQNWLPFFRLDQGGFGSFIAVGWSGQWSSEITHHRGGDVTVTAGLESFAAYLEPGESIRTPRILQLDWDGDRADAHNKLRRFLLDHHTPQVGGKPVTGPFSMAAWGAMPSSEQIKRLDLYAAQRVRQDYFWLDAGWYGADSSFSPDEFQGDWADFVGDWSVNLHRHPGGLLPIRDAAARAGMKFILWAEPGRAIENTPVVTDHPDWFLGAGRERLLDFGRQEAREGAADLFSAIIEENGVDLFREDYNINPLPFWAEQDAPGRVGITESHYVEGFYWFWDELLRRHPGLIIDNCASGGRRLELETLGRSVALWRSDYQCFADADPRGAQTSGMGIGMWLPMHGTGLWTSVADPAEFTTYRVRSYYAPALQMSAFVREGHVIRDDFPWELFHALSDEYLRVRRFYSGDYYPLTGPNALADQQSPAYQLADPNAGEGVVVAFRRRESPSAQSLLRLRGLEADERYEISDADSGSVWQRSGSQLMNDGVTISLESPESSALLFYRRVFS